MTEDILRISIEPGDNGYERLIALGVPHERAKDWARLGPKMHATLWINGPVGVWEVHRELSAHLRIAGWTLLCSGKDASDDEQLVRLCEIVAELSDDMRSRGFPLIKADSWADEGVFVDVLRSSGFEQVTINGNPHPIENDRDYSHSGWLFWNPDYEPEATNLMIPAYEHQKTEFTCGPASALMTLGEIEGDPHTDFVNELNLWRQATYSGGVGHFGLASALADHGAQVEVLVSTTEPIVGISKTTMLGKRARIALHHEHMARARELGVTSQVRELSVEDITSALESGKHIIALVDLAPLNGEDTPHWLLIWGRVGDFLLMHDPWYDEEFGETWVETYVQPLYTRDLWEAAQWADDTHERALLSVRTSR